MKAIEKFTEKLTEKVMVAEGRRIRFTNFVDARSFDFEKSALGILPEAGLVQQLTYANQVKSEFYLLQVTSADGKPALQTIVYIGRPRFFSFFAMATVPSFPSARNEAEEAFGLKLLSELMKSVPGVMSLRVQSKRFESEKLSEFVGRSQKQDYFVSTPLAPVRTMMIELQETSEMLYAKANQRTRQKIRHSSRNQVIIQELTDPQYIEFCDTAMHEARGRTGGGRTHYDFRTVFAVAKHHPDRVRILGLFLKSNPQSPQAYVIGYRSGIRAEYVSAGSFSHPGLRALPYNYFLLWELMNWARRSGAVVMDLGGVSHGGENDPLKGIARFKRSFPAEEVEVGREVVKLIRPSRFAAYSTLKNILSGFRWKNPIQPQVLIYD